MSLQLIMQCGRDRDVCESAVSGSLGPSWHGTQRAAAAVGESSVVHRVVALVQLCFCMVEVGRK